MDKEEMRAAIERPLDRLGVGLEDGLTERIVRDVGDGEGRLPLLEFAITQLWEQRQDRLLTHEAYNRIGGVEQALVHHGERVYHELNDVEKRQMQVLCIQLVQPGQGTEDTRRLATKRELGEDNWRLVIKLASNNNRLVVTGLNKIKEEETVEIVHEALLREWQRLREWINTDRAFRLWQERLRATIKQWEYANKDKSVLLRGVSLSEAEAWSARRRVNLSDQERCFIETSIGLRNKEIKTQVRRKRLITGGLSVGLIIAIVLGMIALWQRKEAKERLLELYEEQGRQELLSGNIPQAAVYLSEAYSQGKKNPSLLFLLGQAMSLLNNKSTYLGHTEGVSSAVFSRDGKRIVTASGDGSAKVWDAETGRLLVSLNGHIADVNSVAFSSDGKRIVTASADNTAKVWDTETGRLLVSLNGHKLFLISATFSADGKKILTASADTSAKVWDADTGRLLVSLDGHTYQVNSAVFSRDGKRIVTASSDGSAKVWDTETGRLLVSLNSHTKGVNSAVFSRDSKRVVTASNDGSAKVWDTETGRLLVSLDGHTKPLFSAVFNEDGKKILTVSEDQTSKIWDTESGKTLVSLYPVFLSAIFSTDGKRILGTDGSYSAKVWDAENGRLLMSLDGHKSFVNSAVLSTNDKRLATANFDGEVKVWDVHLEDRSPQIIADLVNRLVPFRLEQGRLIPKGK
ncbi:MAG: WD40 repeat domain-containing protein [Acidobacteriota bacterium]